MSRTAARDGAHVGRLVLRSAAAHHRQALSLIGSLQMGTKAQAIACVKTSAHPSHASEAFDGSSMVILMVRLCNERRLHHMMVEVERRQRPQKHIAKDFGISYANIRVIIFRYRHRQEACNILEVDKQRKSA